MIALFAVIRQQEDTIDGKNLKKIFGFILVMVIYLFANSYFKTLASG